jgi:hypothetical protein
MRRRLNDCAARSTQPFGGCGDAMTKSKQLVRSLFGIVITFVLFIGSSEVLTINGQQRRLSVDGDHLSCSVEVPSGWRPYKSANGLQYLIPESQKDEIGTGIYIWATPREGKKATKLFDEDEFLKTLDGQVALVRYVRAGAFQSVIRLSDPTTPGAVAYIEKGDFFVEIVVGSTDANFAEAKRVFKTVVESYRRAPPNKSLDRSGGGVKSLPISNCRLSI